MSFIPAAEQDCEGTALSFIESPTILLMASLEGMAEGAREITVERAMFAYVAMSC